MLEKNLGSVEGIVDVSIIVPFCFENPLKEESAIFVHDILSGKKSGIIPISTIIGAYHIVTKYLGVSRISTKSILEDLLETGSHALYSEINIDLAHSALDFAAILKIESWDGYLLALAKKFDAKLIFSMDDELRMILSKGEIDVVGRNPFHPAKVRQYHKFLESKNI